MERNIDLLASKTLSWSRRIIGSGAALYVGLYLIAIVTANLLVSIFGPLISIPTAFVLIGFDLTSRDRLHEAWHNKNLVLKMFVLIATGSLISWILNGAAGRIALASMIAFCVSAILDTMIYAILREKKYMVKVNGSNVISGAADSIIFPTFAFGAFLPLIIAGQFVAKVGGGFLWSLILKRRIAKPGGA